MSHKACLRKLAENPDARLRPHDGPQRGFRGTDRRGLAFWYPQRVESLFRDGLVDAAGALTPAGRLAAYDLPSGEAQG